MKTFAKTGSLLLLSSMLASPVIRAEMTSGTFTNQFSDLALWDLSGTYSEDLGGFDLNYTMNSDDAGKVTGAGTFSYYDWSDYVAGDFSVSGTMKTAGNVVRVTLALTMTGSGVIANYDVDFSAKVKENVEINESTRELLGTMNGKVTVSIPSLGRKKSQSMPTSEVSDTLPDDSDGLWSLSMNLVPNGSTYTGTGAIELSNGRCIDVSLTGSYSAKKNTSKLLLSGISKAVKLSLSTSQTNGVATIQSLKGNTLGQKLLIAP